MLHEKIQAIHPSTRKKLTLGVAAVGTLGSLIVLRGMFSGGGFSVVFLILLLIAIGALFFEAILLNREIDLEFEEEEHTPEQEEIDSPKSRCATLVAFLVCVVASVFAASAARVVDNAAIASLILLAAVFTLRFLSGVVQPAHQQETGYRQNWLAENAGGLAAAAIMIILSYTFVLEAFRIPTGSMEPTLYGNPIKGDRVLVNELDYELGDPQRGDICVVRFPLLRAAPYVKRVVGLGGETILIYEGDIYIFKPGETVPTIWRKRGRVREALWLSYPVEVTSQESFRRQFEGLSGKAEVSGSTISLHAEDNKPGRIRFPREGERIVDHNPTPENDVLYSIETVGDLRLRMKMNCQDGEGFQILIERGDSTIRLAQEEFWKLSVELEDYPDASISKAIEDTSGFISGDLELAVADGEAWVRIDGREVARIEFPTSIEAWFQETSTNGRAPDLSTTEGYKTFLKAVADDGNLSPRSVSHVEFLVGKGAVEISDFQMDRDVHYTGHVEAKRDERSNDQYPIFNLKAQPSTPYVHRIAENAYFVMGDNSENSLDSRRWFRLEISLKNGQTHYVGSSLPNPFRSLFTNIQYDRSATREFRFFVEQSWSSAIANAYAEFEGNPSIKELQSDILTRIKKGYFGSTITVDDIYGRRREFRFDEVTALSIEHVPDVPRELMDGKAYASVWPEPRFVD